jgi:hypothetical protein
MCKPVPPVANQQKPTSYCFDKTLLHQLSSLLSQLLINTPVECVLKNMIPHWEVIQENINVGYDVSNSKWNGMWNITSVKVIGSGVLDESFHLA